ncbi:MAG: hypothetical protein L0Y54_23755, partial [Sporichthyaceae bacterium]|nr:hypothetical protein [Sporichthyaceae bacterium]
LNGISVGDAADHGFRVRGRDPGDVAGEVAAVVAAWVATLLSTDSRDRRLPAVTRGSLGAPQAGSRISAVLSSRFS